MEQQQISAKKLKAMEKVKRANGGHIAEAGRRFHSPAVKHT